MERTATSAPSIGSVNLSFDPIGNRVRQIVEQPILAPNVLGDALSEANVYAQDVGASRRVVRCILGSSQRECDGIAYELGFSREAAFDLVFHLFGHEFVYYGRNNPERSSQGSVVNEEVNQIHTTLQRERRTTQEIMLKALQNYQLERLRAPLSAHDHARLIEMYQRSFSSYPFDIQSTIAEMAQNEDVHIYAARSRKDGALYAVSATEQVKIPIDSRWGRVPHYYPEFAIREMGDSAKMPGVNGLNAPLKLMLIREAAIAGHTDLLFCETRAALAAPNIVNHSIGMNYAGFLPKHTVISGPADIDEEARDGVNGRFGNMNVWALNCVEIDKLRRPVDYALEYNHALNQGWLHEKG